ncbi:MAG: 1-acyl-sn-glycerol-3-phosphate acyltransferase [bacterium]
MVATSQFSRRKPPRYKFRPPRHVPFFMWLARRIAGCYLRWYMKIIRVEVADDGLDILESLRGQRVIFTPNHPTSDPAVLYVLSGRLNMNFVWMAARELFENAVQGALMANIGVFSVDRGRRDEDALRAAREVVMSGKNWLVIFPEGTNHQLHDEILPFLPGAARMGLEALAELEKRGDDLPPVYLLPAALRYYYTGDMRGKAAAILARLERRLGLQSGHKKKWRERLAAISELVMILNERHYGVVPDANMGGEARLERLKEIALRRVAEGLGVEPPDPDSPTRNRVRKLLNVSSEMLHAESEAGGRYARELDAERHERIYQLRSELLRISRFMPLRWDYEIDMPTIENFLDILNLLEKDLLGKDRMWGPRAVMIKVGKPVDLREYLAEFKADPVETSERIMLLIENEVRELLKSTANLMSPLPQTTIFD